MTWDLRILWKEFIMWEQICNSDNEIMRLIFGENKWETELGKNVIQTLMEYGKESNDAKELKENMKLYVEAMAVLKEFEAESML